MATNFPTSVDVLTNPVSNDSLNSPSHSAQHTNANDAIEAVESYLLTGAGRNGLVLLSSTSVTANAAIQVDNVFTSTYTNYKIVWSGIASTAGSLFGVLRASGADIGGSGYFNGNVTVVFSGGAVSGRGGNGETFMYLTQTGGSNLLSSATFDLINPQATARKGYGGFAFRGDTFGSYTVNGETNFTTSATGIKIYASNGTLTGTMQIFGIKQ